MFFTGNHTEETFSSQEGVLVWISFDGFVGAFEMGQPFIIWETIPVSENSFRPAYDTFCRRLPEDDGPSDVKFEWRFRGVGSGAGRFPAADSGSWILKFMFIPYWSVAIPFALLSAYLLVSKPRNLLTSESAVR